MITLELGGTYFFNGHLHHLTLSIAWFTMMIMMASSLNPTITTNGARRLSDWEKSAIFNLPDSFGIWGLVKETQSPLDTREVRP